MKCAWSRLGPDYSAFLRQTLPPWIVPKGQDGFNLAVCALDRDLVMCCVRYRAFIPALFGKEVIPGTQKLGKNFTWGNWNSPKFVDSTCFFVARFDTSNHLVVVKSIRPAFFWNALTCKPAACEIKQIPLVADIRLFSCKDGNDSKMFFIDGNITLIREVQISHGKVDITQGYHQTGLCGNPERSLACFDKNWSFFLKTKHQTLGDVFVFLNWFKNGHVTMSWIATENERGCVTENFIKMEKDRIDGLGTSRSPMFSFGTPAIEVDKNKWIGVGHAKIGLTGSYDSSAILNFRQQVNTLFASKNYVRHNSFIYVMYFFLLDIDRKRLLISDCFLPRVQKERYSFSLVFPMTIIDRGRDYTVTCGIGDYYTVGLTMNKQEVLSSCRHDVRRLNLSDYKYHILQCHGL